MPKFDGTGPNSEGPMTGRKKGDCNNENDNFNRPRRRCCTNINNNQRKIIKRNIQN